MIIRVNINSNSFHLGEKLRPANKLINIVEKKIQRSTIPLTDLAFFFSFSIFARRCSLKVKMSPSHLVIFWLSHTQISSVTCANYANEFHSNLIRMSKFIWNWMIKIDMLSNFDLNPNFGKQNKPID